ncbi:ABC transporter substrate-binding protein [Lautropia mirabilis]
MIKKLLVASLLSTTLLPLAATQATPVRWARSADPATLDPHAVNVGLNFNLLHQMYEPLVIRLADNSLQGALAESWKQTDDPSVWAFKLRPGVKFHDGTPLTAADVVFSLKRAQAPSSQMKSLLSSVREVVAVDPLTVHIRTQGPDLVLPDNLTNLFIMSEARTRAHQAEAPQDTASKTENYATRHVNGTGPYTLVSREVDSRTVMKLNPTYWGKGQFPLQVTELTYVPIKSPATRVAALLSGEIDFLQDVPAQDVARLKSNANLKVASGLENRTIFLGLDVGSAKLRHSSVTDRNPLADARVREALALAIDRDAIQKAVMRGLSSPTGMLAAPFVNGYTKALAAYPKADPARARQLLAEAGYPEGFTLTLDAPNDRYVNDEAIATAVAGFRRASASRSRSRHGRSPCTMRCSPRVTVTSTCMAGACPPTIRPMSSTTWSIPEARIAWAPGTSRVTATRSSMPRSSRCPLKATATSATPPSRASGRPLDRRVSTFRCMTR